MHLYPFRSQTRVYSARYLSFSKLYTQLRYYYSYSVFWEQNDSKVPQDQFSYILCKSKASFRLKNGYLTTSLPKEGVVSRVLPEVELARIELADFFTHFRFGSVAEYLPQAAIQEPIWGYQSYNALQYFYPSIFQESTAAQIPDIWYHVFQFLIVYDHYEQKIYVIEYLAEEETSQLDQVTRFMQHQPHSNLPFELTHAAKPLLPIDAFHEVLDQSYKACRLGEVFSLRPARHYSLGYRGDTFSLYESFSQSSHLTYTYFCDFSDFQLIGGANLPHLEIQNNRLKLEIGLARMPKQGDHTQVEQKLLAYVNRRPQKFRFQLLEDALINDLSRISGQNIELTKRKIYFSNQYVQVSTSARVAIAAEDRIACLVELFPKLDLLGLPRYNAIRLLNSVDNDLSDIYAATVGFYTNTGRMLQLPTKDVLLADNNYVQFQVSVEVKVEAEASREYWEKQLKAKLSWYLRLIQEAEDLN
ncbi:MAG: chorismate-binding protein [Saprospiraceae bacterium]|nr:chorismate-binding protein [Saprospiraceae bacterium]